jgi:hypothetical protein
MQHGSPDVGECQDIGNTGSGADRVRADQRDSTAITWHELRTASGSSTISHVWDAGTKFAGNFTPAEFAIGDADVGWVRSPRLG